MRANFVCVPCNDSVYCMYMSKVCERDSTYWCRCLRLNCYMQLTIHSSPRSANTRSPLSIEASRFVVVTYRAWMCVRVLRSTMIVNKDETRTHGVEKRQEVKRNNELSLCSSLMLLSFPLSSTYFGTRLTATLKLLNKTEEHSCTLQRFQFKKNLLIWNWFTIKSNLWWFKVFVFCLLVFSVHLVEKCYNLRFVDSYNTLLWSENESISDFERLVNLIHTSQHIRLRWIICIQCHRVFNVIRILCCEFSQTFSFNTSN